MNEPGEFLESVDHVVRCIHRSDTPRACAQFALGAVYAAALRTGLTIDELRLLLFSGVAPAPPRSEKGPLPEGV